jgi:hypothetical protein
MPVGIRGNPMTLSGSVVHPEVDPVVIEAAVAPIARA